MKLNLEIGSAEKSKISISRNWFTGAMEILVDGRTVALESPLLPSTHFSLRSKPHYEFEVGHSEKHKVVFEKERPAILAGLRAHTYRIFVDGTLIHQQTGY
jgi:hypothetical protein